MALKTNKTKLNTKALGFTIVELLIVIVIIGILAAITIVSYVGISKKANEASLISDLDGAKRQLELYKIEHESYPTILDTNKCPTSPINDTKYCLKNKDFEYTTIDNGLTYSLKLTKSDITFEVTNDSIPKLAEAAPAEPTLPESDWITVGTQRWARKNLNVGTRIAGTTAQTNNATTEKYCYGNTDAGCTNTDANGISYGGLYQWDEAMGYTNTEGAQGICPVGSHIPSDNEWKTLEMSLSGMTQTVADTTGWRGTDEGTKLKSGGSSGLNMPLAGYRSTVGSFISLSSNASLWSSSESSSSAWVRGLDTSQAHVYRNTDDKAFGFLVRCVGN